MPSHIFKNYTELTFENKKYMCLQNYDEFLKRIYGNYMKLPPKEKRIGHHAFKTYWK